jgi:hypothetical protein
VVTSISLTALYSNKNKRARVVAYKAIQAGAARVMRMCPAVDRDRPQPQSQFMRKQQHDEQVQTSHG